MYRISLNRTQINALHRTIKIRLDHIDFVLDDPDGINTPDRVANLKSDRNELEVIFAELNEYMPC